MWKKAAMLALCFFAAALAFAQSAQRNDPFEGIWIAQNEGESVLIIFLDGLSVWVFEDGYAEVVPYSVSSGRLFLDGEPFIFAIVSSNRIQLEEGLGVMLLDRQTSANTALLEAFGWIW